MDDRAEEGSMPRSGSGGSLSAGSVLRELMVVSMLELMRRSESKDLFE